MSFYSHDNKTKSKARVRLVNPFHTNGKKLHLKTLMKKTTLLMIVGAALCLAPIPATFAQTIPGSVLYTPNVDLTTLSQNTFVGTVGGIFLTSYNYYPEVNYLGYADPTGAPLVDSHLVTLWDATGGGDIIASATVPAGTAAPLVDGYRWVELSSTVNLTYNNYYVIGAQTDGVDLWGNLINNNSPDNGNNGQITWSPQYTATIPGYEFSRAGVYDSLANYPNQPANQTSLSDSIYPAPNLGFDVVATPEPSTLGLLGMGAAMLVGFARKQKKQ
jgi:hypothetical protein